MFTKEKQNELFSKIQSATEIGLIKELNKRAKKLENTYKNMMYDTTRKLIEDASVTIDKNMNLNINIKLNPAIPFKNIAQQNIPLAIERGGGIEVEGDRPVGTGSHVIRNIMGVKI